MLGGRLGRGLLYARFTERERLRHRLLLAHNHVECVTSSVLLRPRALHQDLLFRFSRCQKCLLYLRNLQVSVALHALEEPQVVASAAG